MGTSDVLKVLKIALYVQLEKFQNITSDHKSRSARAGSYDFLLYSQQNYSNALLCMHYVLHKTLQWFLICSHDLFEPIRNNLSWCDREIKREVFEGLENSENISKAKFSVIKGGKSPQICFQFFNLY